MTTPVPLPAQGSTSWYSWATQTDTVARSASSKTQVRREVLRAVPVIPIHPTPPTVTLSAAGAASGVTSGVDIAANDAAIRYTGCEGSYAAAAWYRLGVSPVGSSVDASAFSIDFYADSSNLEIKLAGFVNSRSYLLWVDGQPLFTTSQTGPTATGDTHRLRLAFSSRKPRHIRCLTNAGIVGLTIGPTDAIWASARPIYGKRAYFLGDSFTAGDLAAFQTDGYMYALADRFGWEPLYGGELGTGYTNGQGGASGRATFAARALTDIPTTTDVVIVYGGTNDVGASGVQTAAATTFANIATRVPGVPVYVFGAQYGSGAADTTRDATDSAIAAAAAAAPNVVAFTSVKSWITGTGKVGSTTGSGNADVWTSSDGLHPTTAGHAGIAARMYEAIIPTWAPPPTA